MKREEVYKVIDTERDFQEKMVADSSRPDMIEDLHVGDVLSAIDELSPGYKRVLTMRYLDKMKHKDIAKELGVDISTSKTSVFRGTKILRNKLSNLKNTK